MKKTLGSMLQNELNRVVQGVKKRSLIVGETLQLCDTNLGTDDRIWLAEPLTRIETTGAEVSGRFWPSIPSASTMLVTQEVLEKFALISFHYYEVYLK